MRRDLTNFRIDAELLDGLKVVKERDGISHAEQIRRAIRLWLKQKRVKVTPAAASKKKRGA